jgi:hypothetical protein
MSNVIFRLKSDLISLFQDYNQQQIKAKECKSNWVYALEFHEFASRNNTLIL